MILLLNVLVLLFYITCFAMSPAVVGTASLGPDAASCSFSAADADTFAESFEGANSGYDNASWTETVGGGTSDIDADAAHPGTFACADKCSHALKIVYDATNIAKSVSPTFTEKASGYVQFYLYIAAEGLSNSESIVLLSVRDAASSASLVLDLFQDVSGNLQLATRYWDGATLASHVTLAAIATGTWYRIAWTWLPAGTSRFYVNGTEVGGGFDAATRNIAIFHAGATSAAAETATFYIDSIKIDDDTMPGACP